MKATCKFCGRELDVIMLERPQFPNHKEEIGSINACEGSGQPAAVASEDYDGPDGWTPSGKIAGRKGTSTAERMQREARKASAAEKPMPKAAPSWYETER